MLRAPELLGLGSMEPQAQGTALPLCSREHPWRGVSGQVEPRDSVGSHISIVVHVASRGDAGPHDPQETTG